MNNMREPMTRLDLFADFDWLTSNDLTLLLPMTPSGVNFAGSAQGRIRKPAYVWADYLDSVNGFLRSLLLAEKKRKIGNKAESFDRSL